MKTLKTLFAFFLLPVFYVSCAQSQADDMKTSINSYTKNVITSGGPKVITRNILQDEKGNIWMAAFDGVFRYDGKVFTNLTSGVSSARFFSVLEDKKGHLWFGSIGSGVYYYDGKSFKNFTTADGLLNNEVTSIYEDKEGKIWFGVSGGASCYNGKLFRNYIIDGNAMKEDRAGKTFASRRPFEVTAMIEDRKGMFWFASRGNTFVYDGKTFTVFAHDDKPFQNVRCIMEDKKGNIWLGGADGLWRYDGSVFTNFTQHFVGYITEDKQGNIWTSSERDKSRMWTGLQKENSPEWALSRYDGKTLSTEKPTVTEIINKPMIFGILETNDGSIWFGDFDGVHRYDGKTITDFTGKENEK